MHPIVYVRLIWHALYVSGFHVDLVGFEVELWQIWIRGQSVKVWCQSMKRIQAYYILMHN